MKTYKVNGKEIEGIELNQFVTNDNQAEITVKMWNELLEALDGTKTVPKTLQEKQLEALSDKEEPKQEECEHVWQSFTTQTKSCEKCAFVEPKQSTSLKEGCKGCNNAMIIYSGSKLICSACGLELVTVNSNIGLKQPSDLKESIIDTIRETELLNGEKAEHILSLIQSHLVKEIELLMLDGFMHEATKKRIIKIINNIK